MNSINETKTSVLQKIQSDLFPEVTPSRLISKIFGIHVLASLFVLAICPQFGFGLFSGVLGNGHYGLTGLFMSVSHEFCQLMCGLFLTSISAFSIYTSLKITEYEWLLQNKFILIGLLFSVTSSFFWMSAPQMHLIDFILWSTGSLIVMSKPLFYSPSVAKA